MSWLALLIVLLGLILIIFAVLIGPRARIGWLNPAWAVTSARSLTSVNGPTILAAPNLASLMYDLTGTALLAEVRSR
jgi:hypothetical protein